MTAFLSGTVLPLLLAAAGVWFAVGAGRHLLYHPRRACGALQGGGGLRALAVVRTPTTKSSRSNSGTSTPAMSMQSTLPR